MELGIRQPPIRGCIDDLTVTDTTHVDARELTVLDQMATWAIVIRKGKLTNRVKLHVAAEEVIPLMENQVPRKVV